MFFEYKIGLGNVTFLFCLNLLLKSKTGKPKLSKRDMAVIKEKHVIKGKTCFSIPQIINNTQSAEKTGK